MNVERNCISTLGYPQGLGASQLGRKGLGSGLQTTLSPLGSNEG